MSLPEQIQRAALVLLAVFVVSATLAGFLFSIGWTLWAMFAALSVSSLVASYVLGSD